MKKLKLIVLVSFLLNACNNREQVVFDENLLIGNWGSLRKNHYQEYYFNTKNMFLYDPYTGNTLEYRYILRGDSIFRYFIHPELKNQKYEFYSRVVKFDSNQINLRHKTLYRLKDMNTLEMFVNKKIDSKVYYESCYKREDALKKDM